MGWWVCSIVGPWPEGWSDELCPQGVQPKWLAPIGFISRHLSTLWVHGEAVVYIFQVARTSVLDGLWYVCVCVQDRIRNKLTYEKGYKRTSFTFQRQGDREPDSLSQIDRHTQTSRLPNRHSRLSSTDTEPDNKETYRSLQTIEMSLTVRKEELKAVWNSVCICKVVWKSVKWKPVKCFICGLGRLDLYHIVKKRRMMFFGDYGSFGI